MLLNTTFFNKKNLFIGATILCVSIVSGILIFANANNKDTNLKDMPSYTTVLPSSKTIDSLGGWSRVSPPNSDPVYAYTDTVDTVSITVSEQPLPVSFKSDVSTKVAEVAKNFNATTKLEAKSTDFYIGTSASGPQSVIFAKNDVLILIKSQKKIDDEKWGVYIDSLR